MTQDEALGFLVAFVVMYFTQRFLFRPLPAFEAHDVFKEVPANAKANRDRKGPNAAGKAHAL